MKIRAILCVASSIVKLVLSILWMWITLGWKVRKARKAFEKQLTKEGMSKENAKRLSRQFASLKDGIINGVWNGLTKK
ncbi:MAG: hypothetical protein ACE5L6_03055 [Candidatus Bathyarchaeia archaeon]